MLAFFVAQPANADPCADQTRALAVEIETLFDQRLATQDWHALLEKLQPICQRPIVEKRSGATVYRTKPKRKVLSHELTQLPVWVGIDWYRGAHHSELYGDDVRE